MGYSFKIDKIVSYLKRYKEELPKLYTWEVDVEKLVKNGVFSKPDNFNQTSAFDREISLKQLLEVELKKMYKVDKQGFNDLSLWIIKDWGGITGAKDSSTLKVLHEFLEAKNPKFNRIASCSKVASFMYPQDKIIYDSRVAYSLNWIILSESAGEYFFPIPSGRNSKMSAFEMNVLIRLVNSKKYTTEKLSDLDNRLFINNKDKSLYIKKSESYSELNKLIKEINSRLWSGDKRKKMLFYTEMLLFSIADKYVYQDITSRCHLNIN